MSEEIKREAERIRKEIESNENSKLKIALFGQPGAGKSSLINLIIGSDVAKSGAGTDITVDAQIFHHENFLLVDLPGYGTSKFPPNEWFEQFKPNDYDLFLCVFSGKFHEADTKFFKELKQNERICLFVRNKSDDIWQKGKTEEELRDEIINDVAKQVGSKEKVNFISCKHETGLDLLNEAIEESLAPGQKEKFIRSAKARTKEHLEKKKLECKKIVTKYAGLSAANGINPIPGVDVGVDIGIILDLFKKIRNSYGLTDTNINNLGPAFLPIANRILNFATKEGILLLLKKFSTSIATKQVTKYIPFVGQAIAASVGFAITLQVGKSYLNDCHELAEKILENELNYESV